MNLAKQGMDAYQRSQSDVSKTGGHEYNAPHSSSDYNRPQFDDDEVVRTASREGSGDHSLFSSALSFIKQNKDEHEQPIDEEGVQHAHRKAYEEGSASSLSAGSLGSAAAMQVLKQFTSGGNGGGTQSQLISLAMAEASKLFDQSGGASSGNKQDAVNGAAMTVMKLVVQSKFSGGAMGGSNSGGLGGLMGLASKFM
ncbi:beta-flanking protein [Cubamyces menziesii]|nr:beta-flanking protein [Cubamyces menziesii]